MLVDIVTRRRKEHIKDSSQYLYLSKNKKARQRHNKEVLNIDALIQNSVLVEIAPNTKPNKKGKKNIESYYYFYVPVRFGNSVYTVKLFAEQNIGEKEINPDTVHLYDVIEIKKLGRAVNRNSSVSKQMPSTISITEMLSGVKDYKGNPYLFEEQKEQVKQQAIANGTFMKAPNGKQSNLSEDLWLTVRTPNFKNWFGDWENDPANASKVVDENGEPLVVYHGTAKTNKKFSFFKGKVNYFTDNKQVAETYSPTTIYEVFANIKNPIIVNANKENWSGIDIDNITIYGIKDIKQFINHYGGATFKEKGATRTSVADITNAIYYAKEEGQIKNDGIVIKNIYDEGMYNDKAKTKLGNDYVVFDSKQVKSVNNRGTFDTNNEDIYFQKGIKQGTKIVKWTNKFVSKTNSKGKKIPTIETVKHYIQEIIDKGRDFVTLDPNWKVDIANDSYVKNHIVYPKGISNFSKDKKNRYREYIIGLKELLSNAVYTGQGQVKPHGNKKTLAHKKKVNLYHYFVVNVEIDGHLYEVKLHTEEMKGDNANKPQKVHLYSVTENILYQENKKASTTEADTDMPVNLKDSLSGSINTITQDNMFVNKEKATNKIVRGFITGDEIHVTPASDISTYIHEMGHYWLRDLQNYVLSGQATDEVLKEWDTIKTWLNITDDTKHLTREQQETYTRGLETYMMEGKAPSISLRNIFRKISNLMKYIYKRLTFEKVELSRDVHDYFDRLFATEQEIAENLASMETDFNKFMQKQNEKLKQEYENVKQEAHQQAVEILVEETMKEKTEKYKQDIETKKQEFYDNAKKEVEENKLYIATQKAVKDTKLSADELIKKHKENSFSQDEIVSLMNIVADNNLSSIDELIQNVEYFKEPQKVIDEIVNGLIQEYENKVKDPEFIRERAVEAVNNENQIELLALEREMLIYNFYKQDINKETAYTRSKQYRELVKEQAKNYLENMPISKAKLYYKYVQAQQRLNRQFATALQKGDMQQAIQLQEKIVLNSELIRQSLQLGKEFEKKSKNIESFCEKKFYQNDNLVQVFNILNRFNLEHKQQKGYPIV